jgi:RecJ-like exonuclease
MTNHHNGYFVLKDETGHANIINYCDARHIQRWPEVVLYEHFVRVEGRVQNKDEFVSIEGGSYRPIVGQRG